MPYSPPQNYRECVLHLDENKDSKIELFANEEQWIFEIPLALQNTSALEYLVDYSQDHNSKMTSSI